MSITSWMSIIIIVASLENEWHNLFWLSCDKHFGKWLILFSYNCVSMKHYLVPLYISHARNLETPHGNKQFTYD
jgi:hypothetical protein